MANRRMFSKRFTYSAKYLRMPASTRDLYFYLCMDADDDGIVEAFTVMRLINANEDDLRLLATKGFIQILNEDMITLISDWKEHNQIRADRKVDSIYLNLLEPDTPTQQALQPDDNQMTTRWQPDDNQMSAQVSIGKVRLGKDRIGKVSVEGEIVADWELELRKIVDAYNQIFGKNVRSWEGFAKNYQKWALIHPTEKILRAIANGRQDKFWRDKLTLSILFRQKNPRGENVDVIEDLAEKVSIPSMVRL